jgi:hypothetical protein
MALGICTSVGVVHLRAQREMELSNFGDLLMCSLGDPEAIAARWLLRSV